VEDHSRNGAQSQRTTILVVDHDPGVRARACGILGSEGFHCLEAENGPAALTLLQRHSSPVGLMLIAGLMPEMSGLELASLVAQTQSPPLVLLMSAYPLVALKRMSGVDAEFPLLQTPFTPEQLVERVRQMRKRKQ
jgi:two-component system, cell cycle sensor histidine kinase and response regulator CckA